MNPKNDANTTLTSRSINVGLASLVTELTALLDEAEARLGPEPPALTGAEKRRASKPRKGAEKFLRDIAQAVERSALESQGLSATEMMGRLSDAEILKPLDTRLAKMRKRVSDELFTARGDAWEMGLQFYAVLTRRARTDGELAASIEPLRKSFAYRHPSVEGGKPTKTEAD